MKRRKYLILTLIWMAVIFLFSTQSGDESYKNNLLLSNILTFFGLQKFISFDTINFIIRKAAHFSEYFILGLLLYRTLEEYLFSFVGISSMLIGFVYACSDEIHQYFVPGRGPAFRDVLIDTAGVIFGVLLFKLMSTSKKVPRIKKKTFYL